MVELESLTWALAVVMVCLFQASPITPVDSGFRSDLSEYSASQLLSRGNETLFNKVYYPAMKDLTGSCCTMSKQNLSVVSQSTLSPSPCVFLYFYQPLQDLLSLKILFSLCSDYSLILMDNWSLLTFLLKFKIESGESINVTNHEIQLHEINTLDWDELLVSNDLNEATFISKGDDSHFVVITIYRRRIFLSHVHHFAPCLAEQTPCLQQDKHPAVNISKNNVSDLTGA